MDPVSAARNAQMDRYIASLPPEVRAKIVQDGLADAKSVLPVPYWSTVRFAPTIAANTATVLGQVPRKAFQYAIGQVPTVAGFATTDTAQPCDTNLLRSGETLDNADVYIYGLCAELCSNSDAALAAEIWRQGHVELSLNGTQSIRIGTLAMFPGGGGLYGLGQSNLLLPNQLVTGGGDDGGPGCQVGYLSNGNPMGGNFLRFPQPFKWCAVGGGARDATLSIICQTDRDINITLATTRAAQAAGANTSGAGAWTQPTTTTARPVDIRFRLVAVAVSRLSPNT